jgi:AraC-like DNA-binding protein
MPSKSVPVRAKLERIFTCQLAVSSGSMPISKAPKALKNGETFQLLLSRNYTPSRDLGTVVRRHYVFDADIPDDFVIEDGLMAENAFIRILLKGDWQAQTETGEWRATGPIILFGGNSRPLNVRVKGPFMVVGLAFRPSAWRTVFAQPAVDFTNKMVPLSEAWGEDAAHAMHVGVRGAADDAGKVAAMEAAVMRQMDVIGRHKADAEMAEFEAIARVDSTARVDRVSKDLGMSTRQMERRCLATFGLTPKSVLRRSRFLDMAAALRGFSTPDQAELASLRYFDDSHLNREFRHFTNMTPGAFAKANTPLFTAGLELREEGKSIV